MAFWGRCSDALTEDSSTNPAISIPSILHSIKAQSTTIHGRRIGSLLPFKGPSNGVPVKGSRQRALNHLANLHGLPTTSRWPKITSHTDVGTARKVKELHPAFAFRGSSLSSQRGWWCQQTIGDQVAFCRWQKELEAWTC
jgi:hypothetical protein